MKMDSDCLLVGPRKEEEFERVVIFGSFELPQNSANCARGKNEKNNTATATTEGLMNVCEE